MGSPTHDRPRAERHPSDLPGAHRLADGRLIPVRLVNLGELGPLLGISDMEEAKLDGVRAVLSHPALRDEIPKGAPTHTHRKVMPVELVFGHGDGTLLQDERVECKHTHTIALRASCPPDQRQPSLDHHSCQVDWTGLLTALCALANRADTTGQVSMTVKAMGSQPFDRGNLDNDVLAPLRALGLIEEWMARTSAQVDGSTRPRAPIARPAALAFLCVAGRLRSRRRSGLAVLRRSSAANCLTGEAGVPVASEYWPPPKEVR